jgi:capsular polysaccharide transport system permease protein
MSEPSSNLPRPRLRPACVGLRFGTLRTVAALVLREMSTTYGRSPGGYVWAVLEPVASIALLTFVFSLAFRSPPLGSNFPIFYATGFMPFILFNDVSNKLSQSINYSKQLLSYPRVTFIDVILARMILSVLTRLLVSYLIFVGILSIYNTGTQLDLPHVMLSFAMALAFGIGVGTVNCFLMSMFPVWRQAWSILTTPLMLISGVILLVDSLPDQFRYYLTFNPLVHVTAEMRLAFYYSYTAPYVSPVYVFGVSLVLTAIGLIFLRRYYRDILE